MLPQFREMPHWLRFAKWTPLDAAVTGNEAVCIKPSMPCRTKAETGLNAYKKNYIDTGSAKPLYDVLIYGFFFSYLIAWPQVCDRYAAQCTAL